ncbi:MAG: VCBS repeat-containing protein [Candidatus Eisenbacteria sp.]|nr:VCBS repeat-containing protein [Candidatus Eisenbacteria bacterium]
MRRAVLAILFSTILLPVPGIGQCDLDFDAARTYPVGARPFSVARGDFNSDGIDDLATANHDDAGVTILLGRGSAGVGEGGFTPFATYSTADGPRYILTADFDENGILDLAVTHNFDDVVSILLGNGSGGNGDGTFQPPVHYPVAAGPTWLAAGDFNADDILDLVSADLFSGFISVLIGSGSSGVGDGTFQPRVDYPAGASPNSVTAADFDSDGILDLAVADMVDDDVLIFLGNGSSGQGDGTFSLFGSYDTPNGTACVITGDFDRDGITDIGASNYFDDTVSILIGNGSEGAGDGTFQTPLNYPAGCGPPAMTSGYLNDDLILDLAVINYHDDAVSILFGSGDGSFQDPVPYPVGDGPELVRTGDYNEDGVQDLAVVGAWSNDVTILIGRPENDGTFTAAAQRSAGGSPMDIIAADFNEDGFMDLAVADSLMNRVRILINDATTGASFLPRTGYAAGASPVALVAGDFDEDGILDLALADYIGDAVSILIGNGSAGIGDGTFQPPAGYVAGNRPRGLVTCDFDEDGILDLAVATRLGQGVSVLRGNGTGGVGDGTFAAFLDYSVGLECVDLAAGDFNEDDILDLAVATRGSGGIAILVGNGLGGVGDGTFGSPTWFPAGSGPASVLAALLDGDDTLDLAVACETADSLVVLVGNGDGTFQPPLGIGVVGEPRGACAADLDNDGHPDLVTANRGASSLSILQADSTLRYLDYSHWANLGAGEYPAAVIACDLNHDDLPDLITADEGSGTVSIVLNASDCGTTLVAGGGTPDDGSLEPLHIRPNPFRHGTHLTFSVPSREVCTVSIFDVTGRRVRQLMEESLDPGVHEVSWDGCNNRGGRVSPGIYFCRVSAGPNTRVAKLAVIR